MTITIACTVGNRLCRADAYRASQLTARQAIARGAAVSAHQRLRFRSITQGASRRQLRRQQQPNPPPAAAAPDSGAEEEEAASGDGLEDAPPAWDLAQRISSDAASMMMAGEPFTAELILKKGIAEIREQHPEDPSRALLCTQLWNLQTEVGQHEAALEQAQDAYNLMLSYFGENSADAAFHGIRVGISLVATGKELDEAQTLLVYGGSCAQHNLEIFWKRLQELEAEGEVDTAELTLQTKKLMVALAECNFWGAIGIVRKAIQNAEEPELPMSDLEGAWLGGTNQMAMALPPEHPMFETTLRELGRLIPDAAGRPALQAELEGVQSRLREMLYLMKQMPDSMKPDGGSSAGGQQQAEEEEFLP